jgi:hypothetical protein
MPANRQASPASPADVADAPPFGGAALYAGAGVTLACLALYVRTAARDILVGDTPELATVAATLGVAHPSGYPLLTLLGHLFSLLPLGPAAFRMNLTAAVCGAAAVGVVYLTAWHLTRSWLGAGVAATTLALHPLYWSWSLTFEAFPLNNLLAALLACLLMLWETRPGRGGYLVAAALVGGLGLSNHLTMVLIAPATAFVLWRRRERLRSNPRLMATCLAAFAVGLLPYASIPWLAARHPPLSWGDVRSWSDLVALVLRRDYGTGNLVSATEFSGGSPAARLLAFARSFSLGEASLVIGGAFEAYRRARTYFWFTVIGFLFAGPVFIAYANMNPAADAALWVLQRFFLLAHVVVAPLISLGIALLVGLAIDSAGPSRGRLAQAAIGLLAAAAVIVPAAGRYGEINQRDNDMAGRYARDVLDSLEPGSLLLATGDEHGPPALFVQVVEGRRPDVTIVWTPLLKGEWYLRLLRRRFPDLRVPNVRAASFTLLDIVHANRQRPIAVVGAFTDQSLTGRYGVIRHGLVSLVKPLTETFNLVALASENDALLRRYRPPSPQSIHRETFEPEILRSYAAPAAWLAREYRRAGVNTEAAVWFRRALAIDPAYPGARDDLAQVADR